MLSGLIGNPGLQEAKMAITKGPFATAQYPIAADREDPCPECRELRLEGQEVAITAFDENGRVCTETHAGCHDTFLTKLRAFVGADWHIDQGRRKE